MLSKTILMGRMTRDPDLRHTQSGTAVASFTLAVERDFKDKDTDERKADFIDIVAWRQTAEFVSRFFTKGRMAVVEGRLQTRTYEDKDGNKRKAVEVVAYHVYFGDSKREAEDDRPEGNAPEKDLPKNDPPAMSDYEDDGDLPF